MRIPFDTPRGGVAFLLALLLLSAPLAARDDTAGAYRFERIGKSEGIEPDVITRLFRDRRGLLWVGTREGLYLYDGYSAQRFVHDPDDPASIGANSIRTIFQDSSGRMWFGTNTGGLCRIDPGRSDFQCLADAGQPGGLSHESVYAVVEDRDGFIWVGTQDGLNRIEPVSGQVQRVPFGDAHPDGPGPEYVTALLVDRAGDLWVGTVGRGVFVRHSGEARFTHFGTGAGYSDASGFSFLEDSQGDLWAGGATAVLRKRRGASRFEAHSLLEFSEDDAPSVTALAETPGGRILAGTFSTGLYEIDPQDFSVIRYRPVPGDPHSLGDARVTDLLADPGGGLVVATWGAGLQRTTRASRMFSHISDYIDSKGVLSRLVDVESMAADDRGAVWAGSFTNGLLRLDSGEDGPELVSVPLDDLENPTPISQVYPESPGTVWVGATWGLIELDAGTLDFGRYVNDPADPGSLGAGWVTALRRGPDGALWIGTGGSGVWRMAPDGRLTGHAHDPADPSSLSGDYVSTLSFDRQDHLWVGTRSHGFSRCSTAPFRCRQFDPTRGAPLRHHYVTAFYRDGAGEWWLGTMGGGLHRVLRSADGTVDGFEHFGREQGLPDDNVVSFLEDRDGSLWLGTRRGLARLAPDRRRIASYLASDGLVSGLFNRGAAALSGDRLFFGTVSGIVYAPAGTRFEAGQPAPLVFTHAHNLTSGRDLAGLNWADPQLSVDHGDVLQFAFAVLDYEGGGHEYAYRLGEGADWVGLKSSHQITFGDLPPGRHDLQVRGRSARGVSAVASMQIEVVPPFWMTAWFRMLVVAAVVLLALGAHGLRMAGLRRRNEALQRLHEQRERALHKLRRSEAEVSEAAQGLRRLASRLETAKEEERQHISRELHDELGQTLTAAKIRLQMLQNADRVEDAQLQGAVDMMDSMIGQVRAISLDLRPPLLDEAGLVPALKSELKKVSAQTGIPVKIDLPEELPSFPKDVETVVFRACQEAVSNSLRHSGASRVTVTMSVEDGVLLAVVEDDGCGFDVGEVRVRAMRGEHLGLLGLDERVIAVGGTVRLESEPGAGTSLRIRIPVGE